MFSSECLHFMVKCAWINDYTDYGTNKLVYSHTFLQMDLFLWFAVWISSHVNNANMFRKHIFEWTAVLRNVDNKICNLSYKHFLNKSLQRKTCNKKPWGNWLLILILFISARSSKKKVEEAGYLFCTAILKGSMQFRSFLSRNTCQDWGKNARF